MTGNLTRVPGQSSRTKDKGGGGSAATIEGPGCADTQMAEAEVVADQGNSGGAQVYSAPASDNTDNSVHQSAVTAPAVVSARAMVSSMLSAAAGAGDLLPMELRDRASASHTTQGCAEGSYNEAGEGAAAGAGDLLPMELRDRASASHTTQGCAEGSYNDAGEAAAAGLEAESDSGSDGLLEDHLVDPTLRETQPLARQLLQAAQVICYCCFDVLLLRMVMMLLWGQNADWLGGEEEQDYEIYDDEEDDDDEDGGEEEDEEEDGIGAGEDEDEDEDEEEEEV